MGNLLFGRSVREEEEKVYYVKGRNGHTLWVAINGIMFVIVSHFPVECFLTTHW